MTLAKRVAKPKKDAVSPRLKIMIFGCAAAGKTYGSIWPDSYIIDGERGTVHYDELLAERNCARVLTCDVCEAADHVRDLISKKHDYKTIVIDPITTFYEDSQSKWNALFVQNAKDKGDAQAADMQDFGFRLWGKVKAEQKSFQSLLKKIDMNVIVTAHEKPMYGDSMKVVGQTYDGVKGMDYLFDTVIRLVKDPNSERRTAYTLKDRTGKFPERFDYTYNVIADLWGEGMTRDVETFVIATSEQVQQIKDLIAVVKMADDWEIKCLRRAGVESWDDMGSDSIGKCIKLLTTKLPATTASK